MTRRQLLARAFCAPLAAPLAQASAPVVMKPRAIGMSTMCIGDTFDTKVMEQLRLWLDEQRRNGRIRVIYSGDMKRV